MRILSKCEVCGKTALLVKKRTFKVKPVGIVTSKSHTCRHCYMELKNKLDNINKQLP